MSFKKIWFINFTDPIPLSENKIPRRHESLAINLANQGHNITWITDTFSHTKKTHTSDKPIHSCIKIMQLNSLGYKKNISLKRILHNILLSFSICVFILKSSKSSRPDIIFSSFPPIETSFVLSIISKIYGLKFLIDFRDLHPEVFRDVFKGKFMKALSTLILFPYRFMVFVTLKLSHKVFTTSPGISDYLKAKYRLKKLPSSYYHWYKGNNDLENKQINDYFFVQKIRDYIDRFEAPIIFTYCGVLSNRLDLINFVKAFQSIKDSSKVLVLCGSGDQLEIIKKEASFQKNIFVSSHVSREEVSQLYSLSDYGILPYPPAIDFCLAPPTKLSELLYHNLKIICSKDTYIFQNYLNKIDCDYYEFNNFESLREIVLNSQKYYKKKSTNREFWEKGLSHRMSHSMAKEIIS